MSSYIFDERNTGFEPVYMAVYPGTVPATIVEEGDEAILQHEKNLVVATVTNISGERMTGKVTRSAYDPDGHPDLVMGKEVSFMYKHVFGVVRGENR
jgi:hypothetical protein